MTQDAKKAWQPATPFDVACEDAHKLKEQLICTQEFEAASVVRTLAQWALWLDERVRELGKVSAIPTIEEIDAAIKKATPTIKMLTNIVRNDLCERASTRLGVQRKKAEKS